MTLGELTDLVTTKVHRNDAPSRAEAKVYIRSRYSMIWDSRPWRDTQRLISVNVAAAQVAILPAYIDRVIACRWNEGLLLQCEQPITMLALNPGIFDQAGDPVTYSIISPSGVAVSPGGAVFQLASNVQDAVFHVTIHGALQGVEASEIITTSGNTWIPTVNAYDEVFSLSKDSTTERLTVLAQGGFPTLLELSETDTSKAHQRIHFHSTPQNTATALVLAKARCKPLINDSDSTEISGVDHGLACLAEADMLEAGRQYAKAQMKFAEANQLIATAADLETNQSANIVRIIPWDGGGYEILHDKTCLF